MTSTVRYPAGTYEIVVKIFYSVAIGVVGTSLLVIFLASFLHIFTVIKGIPWLLGVNSSFAGYHLIDKTRDDLKRKHLAAISVGVLIALFSFVLLNLLLLYFVGIFVLTKWYLLAFLIVCALCCEFGAVLAIRYFKLSQ